MHRALMGISNKSLAQPVGWQKHFLCCRSQIFTICLHCSL